MKRLLFAVGLLLVVTSPATATEGATVVANPGTFRAELLGGNVKIVYSIPIGANAASTIEGTIDSSGSISIPASGVDLQPFQLVTSHGTFALQMKASDSWSGQLDPSTGQVALRMRATVDITGVPGCSIGPVDLNRLLSASSGGSGYDSSGAFTVAIDKFSVPEIASSCGIASLANGLLGLTGGNGSGSASFNFRTNTVFQSGGATLGNLSSSDPFSSSVNSTSVIINSTINNYLQASSSNPLELNASLAKPRYRRGYLRIHANCSQDCVLTAHARVKRSSRQALKAASKSYIAQQDQERTMKIKLTRSIRRALQKKNRLVITVEASNGEESASKRLVLRME